jgi:hypothetical protein
LPAVHPPVKSTADACAGEPQFDIIRSVGHRVLYVIGQQFTEWAKRKFTLIMTRRTLTEPKTALAGVTLDIFLAMPRPSIATINAERRPSRSLGR